MGVLAHGCVPRITGRRCHGNFSRLLRRGGCTRETVGRVPCVLVPRSRCIVGVVVWRQGRGEGVVWLGDEEGLGGGQGGTGSDAVTPRRGVEGVQERRNR